MKTLTWILFIMLMSWSSEIAICQASEMRAGVEHSAQPVPAAPKVLIVVAHPDDESCFAATVYQITHNLGGTVEQLVVTNGEGGYRYSLLAEPYYGIALTTEPIGRAALPEIRKAELLGSGRILGIAKHYLLDQPDLRYTQDADEVLSQHWNSPLVDTEILSRLESGHYDFVFTLFPSTDTHGAHKAATLIAIDAVEHMHSERPAVLGCQDSSVSSTAALDWNGFDDKRHPFPVGHARYSTDRTTKFGFKDALNYQVIVNWVIAEHKSQGAFQMDANRFDHEQFAVLGSNTTEGERKTQLLFQQLTENEPNVNESLFEQASYCHAPACRNMSPNQLAGTVVAARGSSKFKDRRAH